jgi:hypothetical protein
VFALPVTLFAGEVIAPKTVNDDDMAHMRDLYARSMDPLIARKLVASIRDQMRLAEPLCLDAQIGRQEQLLQAFGFEHTRS